MKVLHSAYGRATATGATVGLPLVPAKETTLAWLLKEPEDWFTWPIPVKALKEALT